MVKHFQHTEALKAYMSVTKSARMQGVVGSIPQEYRFRLGNSGEFVQALIEGGRGHSGDELPWIVWATNPIHVGAGRWQARRVGRCG